MIWQNPWIWASSVVIGLPLLIHLLGRSRAPLHRFPTLRFLHPSRLLPTRRTQIHDPLLLAVRAAILLAAVAALAQPLFLSAFRQRSFDGMLARAVIVDTSASMRRPSASGEPVVTAALREAQRLGDSAGNHIVLTALAPAQAIPGAVAWLQRQTGRAELVLVSDFQVGTFAASDIKSVPEAIGVRLARVAATPATLPTEIRSRYGAADIIAKVAPTGNPAEVEWTIAPASRVSAEPIVVWAGREEETRSHAAREAGQAVGIPLPIDSTREIVIVEPGFDGRPELSRRAGAPDAAWMIDIVARLQSDALLAGTAFTATIEPQDSVPSGIVIARNGAGQPVVVAAKDTVEGRKRFCLFLLADAGSRTSAALVVAANRALSRALPPSELEPTELSDSVLAAWQRSPATHGAVVPHGAANGDRSDGRWFWGAVLLLLAIETWLRRGSGIESAVSAMRDAAI